MPMVDSSRTRLKRVAVWIVLTMVLGIGATAYYLSRPTAQDELIFDRDLWQHNPLGENRSSPRYRMIGDLLRRYRLVGMTRAEVVALLGPIEYPRGSSRRPYPGWDLGDVDGLFGLPAGRTFMVKFGPDDRVVKTWSPGR